MQYNPANPLIVQGDRTILLEVDNPLHAEARDWRSPWPEGHFDLALAADVLYEERNVEPLAI